MTRQEMLEEREDILKSIAEANRAKDFDFEAELKIELAEIEEALKAND